VAAPAQGRSTKKPPRRCDETFERAARASGYRRIAGLDEAGRGCLFGPVYAAAVILAPERPIRGLRDSKQLSAARREELAELICERAEAWDRALRYLQRAGDAARTSFANKKNGTHFFANTI
jgi:ribonuclease HII